MAEHEIQKIEKDAEDNNKGRLRLNIVLYCHRSQSMIAMIA